MNQQGLLELSPFKGPRDIFLSPLSSFASGGPALPDNSVEVTRSGRALDALPTGPTFGFVWNITIDYGL